MKLYLIRHGITEATEKHLYCGSTDLSLSEEGKRELKPLNLLEGSSLRYISSGMRRCNETLDLLFPGASYTVDSSFREIDFGTFEMRGYEELKTDPAYIAWIGGDNEVNTPPGGESGKELTERALTGLKRVISEGKDAVIVTHGGVIAVIMTELFPDKAKTRYEWQPLPGNGYKISFRNGKPMHSERLISVP